MADNHERSIPNSESTSTTLIQQLKAGDEDSWAYFLFAYRPLIVNWALQVGASRSDATEVAQEVVSNVVQGMEAFQKGERTGSFRKWLKTITHRRAVDHLRKKKRLISGDGGTANLEQIHQVAAPISDETRAPAIDDRTLLIERTLAYLRTKVKPHTYDAFHRVVVENQDPADVAQQLQISVDVVYQANSRMLSRLRTALGSELDEDGS